MSTSDDEKCVNELPKLKTKILNKNYTREILRYYIKEKKNYYKLFKRKIRKRREKITSIGM